MKKENARRIKTRVRSKILGTKDRPRMSVHRTLKHVYVQLINDVSSTTILSFSDSKLDKKEVKGKTKSEVAQMVGNAVAKEALGKKIKSVIFDRGSRRYHGRIKALAESAREGGLKF